MRTTWKIPMGSERIMTGDFNASITSSPLHCQETVTASTPIIRKNTSRLCSHHLTLKGKINTRRAIKTSPITIHHIGWEGSISMACKTGIFTSSP